METTEWFPADVKPVHVGVYERDWSNAPELPPIEWFDRWDGVTWRYGRTGEYQGCANRQWRGLTEQAK